MVAGFLGYTEVENTQFYCSIVQQDVFNYKPRHLSLHLEESDLQLVLGSGPVIRMFEATVDLPGGYLGFSH